MPQSRLRPVDLGIGELFWLINDAVIVGDAATGSVVLWNPGAERMFGYAAAVAVGMPLAAIVPPRLRDAHQQGLSRFGDTGEIILTPPGENVEVPALRADGTEFWVELSLGVVPADLEGSYVVACIRDVTARRTAQENLRNFVAVAAHDLRSPLSALTGGLSVLRRAQPELTLAAETVLSLLERQAQALTALTSDLLDVARIDAGELAPASAEVLVLEIAEVAATLTGEPPAAVEVCPTDLRVTADPAHVQRILFNLVANAARHGAPPITIRAAPAGAFVEIEVCDAGPGVPAGFETSLFNRFARTGESAGTGLGLAIARGLAQANGGDIRYQRNTPTGSRFVVTLRS